MPFRSLSTEEVAVYLHVSKKDVEQWVRANEIPFELRGGRAYFIRAELDAWASQRILSLPARRLVEYHQDSTEGMRERVDQDALMPILISSEYIKTELVAKTRRSVIDEMVELASSTDRVNDAQELFESVSAREDLCPTALPGGIALLHCRNHDPYRFEGSFLVFGRSIKGLHFSAPDGRATRFFFLMCAQEEELHLHMLARLCLMAQATNLIERLYGCVDAEEMYNVLIESEAAALEGRRFPKVVDGNGDPIETDVGTI